MLQPCCVERLPCVPMARGAGEISSVCTEHARIGADSPAGMVPNALQTMLNVLCQYNTVLIRDGTAVLIGPLVVGNDGSRSKLDLTVCAENDA